MTVDPVLVHAFDWSLRAAILLVPALLFALLSRRSSASVRHAACFGAVAVALSIPLLASLIPSVGLPVLPPRPATGPIGAESLAAVGVFLVGLWLGGAMVVAFRVASGVARAQMLCRLATEVKDARVLTMAIRVRREIGLSSPLRVLSQRRLGMPFTWGIRRAVVLLPNGADRWSRGRLRAVLLHELSHVKRRDCLTQLVADLACAVWWFHPLVWLAAARMRVERERACDDTVVTVGGRPSGYATLLLRMVKGIHRGTLLPEPVASFGSGGGLTGRLRALLGPARDRRALSPASVAAFALGALTLALPVAAVDLTRRASEPVARPAVAEAVGHALDLRPYRVQDTAEAPPPRPVPAAEPPPVEVERVLHEVGVRPIELSVEKGVGTSARTGRVTFFASVKFFVLVPGTPSEE